ncbi:BACON domain-containing protein [Leeuwenhoekiella marinoflava]|uniref:Uncharacterized protein n=2 Tax=Leeuwenhoekiella marinoflava TaxID=988 RepID=A0A4Q0PF78_9FLAO|nr:BACON domain-containing protein [Leeuwenhoekiella marinoflava]RXG25461.1 hypothetical protein DSL99_3496 [Leeuwenhoekiella marinoflava]SHF86344.1 hypothetical protein SAMN02745246_03590 [Leeuwenhoekiella marinoflava DSM 3653]
MRNLDIAVHNQIPELPVKPYKQYKMNPLRMRISIGLVLTMSILSCSSDKDEINSIQPSVNSIVMEAEGGETEIAFTNGDWDISKILNKDGNMKIHGDIYTQNGELTQQNIPLSLDDTGKLTADWGIKGFTITRTAASSLNVELLENSTGEPFSFTIVLSSGNQHKKIDVTQKISQGYQYVGIDFLLKEEDGDSIFVKEGIKRNFKTEQPLSFKFSPYEGINILKQSRFQSSEKDAFIWLKDDSIAVDVPTDLYDDTIHFNEVQSLYNSEWVQQPHEFNKMESITVPAGESSFTTEVEFRQRQISYQLHLINNRTSAEKIIEGKWIEIAPTGTYTVERLD